jgi:hypothetical protein
VFLRTNRIYTADFCAGTITAKAEEKTKVLKSMLVDCDAWCMLVFGVGLLRCHCHSKRICSLPNVVVSFFMQCPTIER